jgi:hypothetical protein
MAVLVASLLAGNASSIVPRLFPGAQGLAFATTETIRVMQDQLTFLINQKKEERTPTAARAIFFRSVGNISLVGRLTDEPAPIE